MDWKTTPEGRRFVPGDPFTATARKPNGDDLVWLAHDCTEGRVDRPTAHRTAPKWQVFHCSDCGLSALLSVSGEVAASDLDMFQDPVLSLSTVRAVLDEHSFTTAHNDPVHPVNCSCGNEGRVEQEAFVMHLAFVLKDAA